MPYAAVVAGVAWPNDPSVTEMEDDVSPTTKSQPKYFVLSPPSDGNGGPKGDMIASTGCDEANNRRNQEGKMDHILHQAEVISKKRNLECLYGNDDSEKIKEGADQLMHKAAMLAGHVSGRRGNAADGGHFRLLLADGSAICG